MPDARLARTRATLPVGYVYEPPPAPAPLSQEVDSAAERTNDTIRCVHCARPWLDCFAAPCHQRIGMRLGRIYIPLPRRYELFKSRVVAPNTGIAIRYLREYGIETREGHSFRILEP